MNRKTIVTLASCLLFALVLVVGLYAATFKIVHEPNNFLRIYQKHAVTKTNELDIEFNSYYLAGITNGSIYLGNIEVPFNLLMVNHALTDTQQVKITLTGFKKPSVYKGSTVKIDSPYFYLADGIKPAIYRGKLGDWKAERFMFDSVYFNAMVPVNHNSFAIRTSQVNSLDHVLGRVDKYKPHVAFNDKLLQKQVDGFFCTDGMLHYNQSLNRLVYLYLYRNEYIVYDSNLNLSYRGHTIDTFSRAQIKVGYIESDGINKLLSKKIINARSATSGKYLYVKSNLLAKNDLKNALDLQSVIDVYDLTSNTYKFSFTVTNYDPKTKMRDFMVHENRVLIALYDHYMVTYDLQSSYFDLTIP